MDRTELKFVWSNDESYDIYIQGQYICNMNHDDHGWSGMGAMESALRITGAKLDWDIVTVHEEAE